MKHRRKFISPGMEVRIAPGCGPASWLHRTFAEQHLAGTVVGKGWGVDCWRVCFPPAEPDGRPRVLAFHGRDLFRLGPRKPAAAAQDNEPALAGFPHRGWQGPTPGVLLSMVI
jgi:hypothetical protein